MEANIIPTIPRKKPKPNTKSEQIPKIIAAIACPQNLSADGKF
jgi:hypothetical protein